MVENPSLQNQHLHSTGISQLPLASIVISIFRRDQYLKAAIESALNQTWPSVEVIVAEDGGSDCANSIVAEFGLPETKLRLVRQPSNIGAAANKLFAWRAAKGNFIVNLDDDDLLEPEFISTLIPPLLNDPSLILSFCDHYLINEFGDLDLTASDENSKTWKRDILAPGTHRPFMKLGVIDQSIPFAMGALWNKSLLNLNNFRIESSSSYDLFMTYIAAQTGLGAFYVPQRLVKYRIHSQMETRCGRERIYRANIFCHRQFLKDPILAPWRSVILQRLSDAFIGLGVVTLREHRRGTAIISFMRSLIIYPTRRALVGLAYSLLPNGPKRVY